MLLVCLSFLLQQPDPYVAAVSYTASERDASEGIISFQQGQEFQIVDQSSDLWWLVHSVNSSGTGSTVEGWVPASYLDKKEDYENMIKEQQLTNVSIEELKQGEDIQNMRNQPPSVDQGGKSRLCLALLDASHLVGNVPVDHIVRTQNSYMKKKLRILYFLPE